MRWTRHTVRWAIAGGLAGMLQLFLAFLCGGAGHGTMFPLIVSTSPLALVPCAGMLFGAPVLWGGVAVLAVAPRTRRNKWWFVGVMLAHYLVAAGLVCWTPACSWDMIAKTEKAIPGFFGGWLMSYCIANFFAWWLFFGGLHPAGPSKLHAPERTEIDERREQVEVSTETANRPKSGV